MGRGPGRRHDRRGRVRVRTRGRLRRRRAGRTFREPQARRCTRPAPRLVGALRARAVGDRPPAFTGVGGARERVDRLHPPRRPPQNAVQAGSGPRVGTAGSLPGASRDPRKAPKVVRGRSGYLFLGDDFDAACRRACSGRGCPSCDDCRTSSNARSAGRLHLRPQQVGRRDRRAPSGSAARGVRRDWPAGRQRAPRLRGRPSVDPAEAAARRGPLRGTAGLLAQRLALDADRRGHRRPPGRPSPRPRACGAADDPREGTARKTGDLTSSSGSRKRSRWRWSRPSRAAP